MKILFAVVALGTAGALAWRKYGPLLRDSHYGAAAKQKLDELKERRKNGSN